MQPYPTIQNYSPSYLSNPYWMNGQAQSSYAPTPAPIQMPQTQMQMAGRFVGNFGEVTANDVPMDGKSAVFVKNDKSEIQIREWSPNGQIVTISYLPQICENTSETDKVSNEPQKSKFDPKSEVLEPIFERLSQLEDKLDRISRPTRAKKEVADE